MYDFRKAKEAKTLGYENNTPTIKEEEYTSFSERRYDIPPSHMTPQSIIEKEWRENRKALDVHHKILKIEEQFASKDAIAKAERINEINGNNPFNRVSPKGLTFNDLAFDSDDFESDYTDAEMLSESVAPTNNWKAEKMQAKMKSGAVVPVWKPFHKNGMEYPKFYRIQEVAEQVTRLLNTTGNVDDPRIERINETYSQYMKIHKKYNMVKKAIREGNTQYVNQKALLKEELDQLIFKLGL